MGDGILQTIGGGCKGGGSRAIPLVDLWLNLSHWTVRYHRVIASPCRRHNPTHLITPRIIARSLFLRALFGDPFQRLSSIASNRTPQDRRAAWGVGAGKRRARQCRREGGRRGAPRLPPPLHRYDRFRSLLQRRTRGGGSRRQRRGRRTRSKRGSVSRSQRRGRRVRKARRNGKSVDHQRGTRERCHFLAYPRYNGISLRGRYPQLARRRRGGGGNRTDRLRLPHPGHPRLCGGPPRPRRRGKEVWELLGKNVIQKRRPCHCIQRTPLFFLSS